MEIFCKMCGDYIGTNNRFELCSICIMRRNLKKIKDIEFFADYEDDIFWLN